MRRPCMLSCGSRGIANLYPMLPAKHPLPKNLSQNWVLPIFTYLNLLHTHTLVHECAADKGEELPTDFVFVRPPPKYTLRNVQSALGRVQLAYRTGAADHKPLYQCGHFLLVVYWEDIHSNLQRARMYAWQSRLTLRAVGPSPAC